MSTTLRSLPLLALLAGCAPDLAPTAAPVGVPRIASEGDELWLGPNVASEDMLELFSQPEGWPQARQRLSVFQFYAQQIGADMPAACPSCGGNIFPNLQAVGAFQKLRDWGIAAAIETGAVKHHTCDGEVAAQGAAGLIDRVADSGGAVGYVAMDEPYLGGEDTVGGQSCRYGMAESAQQTARFMSYMAAHHPAVQIVDVEPYPRYRVPQLLAWIDELGRLGARPAALHLDVDRNAVRNARTDVTADLRALRDGLADRGVPLGVIFWGHELDVPRGADPERAYHEAVLGWVRTVRDAVGKPAHAVFQSWLRSPDGRNVIPRNLTEDRYSHTRLLNDGWALLAPPPPPPPPAEDAAVIKVRHGYAGILGRPADEGGLRGYADALRGGMSTLELCRSLFGSDEYRDNRGGLSADELTEALYRGVLEREPDPGGRASTLEAIRDGRRADVAAAMLDSAEFRARFLP